MDLTGIISITGRPGLYLVVAQGKNSIIVESLTEKKRFPAYSTDRVSALDDISIYTVEKDFPLKDVFLRILEKENGKETLSHSEDFSVLQKYMLEILPDYDQDRVYVSDIKKVFQWYNILLKAGRIQLPELKEEKDEQVKEMKTPAAKDKKEAAPAAKKKAQPSEKKAPADKVKKASPKK